MDGTNPSQSKPAISVRDDMSVYYLTYKPSLRKWTFDTSSTPTDILALEGEINQKYGSPYKKD
ncbi:MAG: hypothetical protein ACTHLE_20135 [Agriterribacter sp.]